MSPDLRVPGTQGYAESAEQLIQQYESISFERAHEGEMQLIPPMPSRVLDVGAGSGRDAAWYAARGHSVMAVEPTTEFRTAAIRLHPSPSITWVDDALPNLDVVLALNCSFDLVLLNAVWMHLDEFERSIAMPRLSALLAPGGLLMMSLRHGPVPPGRRMFDVSGEETIELAQRHGFLTVLHTRGESVNPANRALGVTWTRVAFERPPVQHSDGLRDISDHRATENALHPDWRRHEGTSPAARA